MVKVVVIGGGIGGLTCGALLAEAGYEVTLYEQAQVLGGCASTFRRGAFTFDVGATQVAGLEPGGIHWRVFQRLGLPLPPATDCDPACAVFLPGEREPINVWRDPERWSAERERQFPGSEPFWRLIQTLFAASWRFQARDPVVPPRSLWDLGQLVQAFTPDTWITAPFSLLTVGDALRFLGLGGQRRLKTFLDLQLKLYSQVGADETALLYGATALSVSQAPQGLFHLQGSMQVLSDSLAAGLQKFQGQILTRRRVEKIHTQGGSAVGITVRDLKTGVVTQESADQIVANVTVQDLVKLLDTVPWAYQQRVTQLAPPSGAFVLYLGVTDAAIPADCPPHLQFLYNPQAPLGENNSLFVSVSKSGDGRAPLGKRTLIASSFTEAATWWGEEYKTRKQAYCDQALQRLGEYFTLTPETLLHQEGATPRTFAHYTARAQGFVGGVGQRLSTFGPFGFATRSPVDNLWLVGDSVHPGEGTAGVSYAAWTTAQQIQNQ